MDETQKGLPVFTFLLGPGSPAGAESFDVTNLVTDDPINHPAKLTDPTLQNAWGVSYTSEQGDRNDPEELSQNRHR